MLIHRSATQTIGRVAGAAGLAAILLSACGGGGSGDPVSTSSSSSSSSSTSTSTSSGTTAGLDGLNCVAATGGGAGYILGVCSVVANGVESVTSQFQTFPVTVTVGASKSYTLNIESPAGTDPGARTMDGTTENCDANRLGSRTAYAVEYYSSPTTPATSPRYTLLSFTQNYGARTNLCRLPTNAQVAASYPMTYMDFGAWERYAGGATIYYGGWYAPKTATNAVPAAGKTYGAGAVAGYRFTQSIGYGMSGNVNAGATWNGSALTLTIDGGTFEYSRPETNPPSPGTALPVITLVSSTVAGAKVTGIVQGNGVTGIWEGQFGGAAGEEFAGQFQFVQAGSGHKVTGAFAVK